MRRHVQCEESDDIPVVSVEYLLVRSICRRANSVFRMCEGKIFDMIQNSFFPLILHTTQFTDIGREAGVYYYVVFPGIIVNRNGAENEESSSIVKFL